MSGLEDLYREIILDHYRSPRNRGELETPPAHKAEGFNPLCGDEIVVFVEVDGKGEDARITDVKIGGQGCSISQASASMMSAAVKGRTVAEAHQLTRAFKAMMSIHENGLDTHGSGAANGDGSGDGGGEGGEIDEEALAATDLGDLEALRGVVKFPVRIKCATLSWNTLGQGLADAADAAG